MSYLPDRAVERLQRGLERPDVEGTRYRLVRELGQGGMATVYLAEDAQLEREVAIKVLRPEIESEEFAARLLREARIIARLEHPGIVPVHDAGVLPDGRVFYAMKRVDGRPLREAMRGAAGAELLRVFQRICEAVAFAHASGVVHRDLKPENVMIGAFGEVLVMDWGVAKAAGDAASARTGPAASGWTQDGVVAGTPAYMAPEQARGEPIDARADVYALGVLLKELTGPDAARPLRSIIAKAQADRPECRYSDAAALSADVARFLNGERVLAHRESAAERAGRFYRRYEAAILLIAAYLVMRALLLAFLGR